MPKKEGLILHGVSMTKAMKTGAPLMMRPKAARDQAGPLVRGSMIRNNDTTIIITGMIHHTCHYDYRKSDNGQLHNHVKAAIRGMTESHDLCKERNIQVKSVTSALA